MRIILDGVFNHTGDDSRYFNRYSNYPGLGAYQSTESPYYDWYTFHGSRDRYDSWWGIDTLPAIKESSQSYQNFMFSEDGVIKHWLRHGIGGYRLDVADELPGFFLKMLRKAARRRRIPMPSSSARFGRTLPTRSPTVNAASTSRAESWTA